MRLFSVVAALTLTACSTGGLSPTQHYRFAGNDDATKIQGAIRSTLTQQQLAVFFDYERVILGNLDSNFNGELAGQWKGKPVTAICNGRNSGRSTKAVDCMIFVGNERTVTLTFN